MIDAGEAGSLESSIGTLLRVGVVASTTLLAAGLLLAISGIAEAASRPLLSAAVLILLATPAARVIVSIVAYVREGDWLFAALTMIVLLTLAGSVAAAFW